MITNKIKICKTKEEAEREIEKMKTEECDFCGKKCDGKLVLIDSQIVKKDGSNIVLCGDCMNYYANQEYEKIKLKGGSK